MTARMIAGDTHTDSDTLCAVRCNNLDLVHKGFVRMLEMPAPLKGFKVGPITVAVETVESKAEAVTSQKEVLSQTAS